MLTREQVLEQVLALPPSDQAFVADALDDRLVGETSVSEQVAQAWSEEIDRRLAAYDRGETQSVSFDQALGHLQQALSEHRVGPGPQCHS